MGAAIVNFTLGLIFTYLAIFSGDTLWGFRTILPALVATIDFGISIRLFRIHFLLHQKK